jgi:hypothetical protein
VKVIECREESSTKYAIFFTKQENYKKTRAIPSLEGIISFLLRHFFSFAKVHGDFSTLFGQKGAEL